MTEESRQDRPATVKAGKGGIARTAAETRAAAESGAGTRTSGGRATPPGMRARPDRYLIAAADIRTITAQLEQDESCSIVRTVRGPITAGGFPGVVVAEMTPEHAIALRSYPGICVEPDLPVARGQRDLPLAAAPPGPPVTTQHVAFEVVDDGMRPVEGAAVTLAGTAFRVTAFTDAEGRAELVDTAEALAGATMAEIRPPRGCWPLRVRWPQLNRPVRVTCTRVTSTHPDFPERALDSWGTRVMGFGRLPPTYRAHGVQIALIDSGAATGHPDLTGQLQHGRDILRQDEKSWQEDLIGTGTHHATLIAGRDDGTGIVGLASEAQTHICRVAPGGSVADLIEALDYCIEQQVDVAMLAGAVGGYSPLLAAKVEEAWQNGIACVAAAGGFPAALPHVLTVGAIGQLGTFPPESTDTTSLTGQVSPEGFFVPRFSPPGSDCCAPGVAIISGLPPTSYGPLSGTSTAAAHVTALAALILAHHPLFRPEPGRPRVTRDASRPARLFDLIRASCRPLQEMTGRGPLDPARTGAGLPDAAVALGVAPWGTYPQLSAPYPAPPPGPGGRTSLEPLTAAMRAAGLLPS